MLCSKNDKYDISYFLFFLYLLIIIILVFYIISNEVNKFILKWLIFAGRVVFIYNG